MLKQTFAPPLRRTEGKAFHFRDLNVALDWPQLKMLVSHGVKSLATSYRMQVPAFSSQSIVSAKDTGLLERRCSGHLLDESVRRSVKRLSTVRASFDGVAQVPIFATRIAPAFVARRLRQLKRLQRMALGAEWCESLALSVRSSVKRLSTVRAWFDGVA